jgi:hypothetical protein
MHHEDRIACHDGSSIIQRPIYPYQAAGGEVIAKTHIILR